MDQEIRKAVDKIIAKLEKMSQEEFERDVLKLNGQMTDELLEKVLKDVYEIGSLDHEDLQYNTIKKARINAEEFKDVFHYIEEYAGSRSIQKDNCKSGFVDFRLYFHYRGGNFIWRELIGQGVAMQIYAREIADWPSRSPMIYKEDKAFQILEADPHIRFYKD